MFGKAKKLARIPSDLVSYITIETEAIKDANDKAMISSYCIGKLDVVNWYIELLEVGTEKYVVPHSLSELKRIRAQLMECHRKIMATPIHKDRQSGGGYNYPKGYEG